MGCGVTRISASYLHLGGANVTAMKVDGVTKAAATMKLSALAGSRNEFCGSGLLSK